MPLGGELVGTAYVRIIADGEGLDNDIKDMFKDEDFQNAARRNSDAYRDAFRERMESAPTKKAMQESIDRTLAEGVSIKRLVNSQKWKDFRKGLADEFGDAGRLAGKSLEDELFSGSQSISSLESRMNNMVGDLARAQKRLYEEQAKIESEAQKAQRDRIDSHLKYIADRDTAFLENERRNKDAYARLLDEAYAEHRQYNLKQRKLYEDFVKETKDLFAQTEGFAKEAKGVLDDLNRQQRDGERRQNEWLQSAYDENAAFDRKRRRNLIALRTEYGHLLKTVSSLEKGEKGLNTTHRDAFREIDRLRSLLSGFKMDRNGALARELDAIEKRVRTLHPRLAKMNRVIDDTATLLGKSTGKGARNNFFNLIGVMVEGGVRLLASPFRVIGKLVADMSTEFQKADTFVGGLGGAFGTLLPLLGQAAVGIGVAAGALVVLTAAAGPVVAIISMLLGAITALASSVVFAAAGALGVLAGALLPVALAVGAIVVAMPAFGKKLKDLKKDIAPLRKEFHGLSVDVKNAFLKDIRPITTNLAVVFHRLRPLLTGVAGAVSDMILGWSNQMKGPGFQHWLDHMNRVIPGMLRRLGRIASNTLGGIGGIFEGLIPQTQHFLKWLEKITRQFDHWANSKAGQKEIRKFFKDGVESAKSIGHFLEQAWNFVRLIGEKGKGTGDSLFESMGKNIEKFTDYLKKNPDALKNWFKDSEKFAIEVGDLAVNIGKLIDKLDSPEARNAADIVLKLVGAITALTSIGAGAGNTIILKGLNFELPSRRDITRMLLFTFNPAIAAAVSQMSHLKINFDMPKFGHIDWKNILGPHIDWSHVLFGDLNQSIIVSHFKGWGGSIKRAIGKINFNFDWPSLRWVVGHFGGWGRGIAKAMGRIHLFDNFDFPSFGSITSHFHGLGASILKAIGDIIVYHNIQLPSWSSITSHFSGLASSILSAIGTIDLGSIMHIPNSIGGIHIPGQAVGGLFGQITNGPMLRWVGEDGPEAIVPLHRPLAQVDPAVRMLSGIAQGKISVGGGGKHIDASGWTIMSPSADPRVVAVEALNRLVAQVS